MKTVNYIFLTSILTILIIGSVGYVQTPGGGTGGLAFAMGGGQGGMMGGQGGMMGGYLRDLWNGYRMSPKEYDHDNQDLTEESSRLRKQIRDKRAELSALYRSDHADKTLIEKKIDELNRLERRLDEKMSTY
ncbi:MAG: hypothetical protein ACE5DO_04880 [Desulfobacterales bacterium]